MDSCKKLLRCTPSSGRRAAGEQPAGSGLVIMCRHTRAHARTHSRKIFTFISGKEKLFPCLGLVNLRRRDFGSRGRGAAVRGPSTNHCNSLEPAPLESNWHFEINLCQEPSRSILQQSRVHSALTIRQLKIKRREMRTRLDPSS